MAKNSEKTIVILIGANPDSGRPDEREGYEQAEAIASSLQRLGYDFEIMHITSDLSSLKQLKLRSIPFVFNLVEEIEGDCHLAHLASGMLETLGIPFSGASALSYSMTTDKIWTKKLLRLAKLPTPAWSVDGLNLLMQSQVIIKSVDEDASFGIDCNSVISASGAADALQAKVQEHGGRWFAEIYLEGREFNLSLIEIDGKPIVLPIAEMEFQNYPPDTPRIMCYASKWEHSSFAYQHTQRKFINGSDPLSLELKRLALAVWDLFGLKGYARIDFRCDSHGKPYIIEANPNPSLSPDGGFVMSAFEVGIDFDLLIALMLPKHLQTNCHLPEFILQENDAQSENIIKDQILWRHEVKKSDIEEIRSLIASSGFFNEEEIDVAVELVEEGFSKGSNSGYEFIIAESEGKFLGYACYSRIPGTYDSYDLYWIAVQAGLKRQGMGKKILTRVEEHVAAVGGKRLYIQTAGRELYAPTKAFYLSCGYTVAAELPNYYGPDDAQITFVKILETEV